MPVEVLSPSLYQVLLAALFLTLAGVAAGQELPPPVRLVTPVEYQVFQQDAAGQALVPVRVDNAPNLPDAQVRFVVAGACKGATTDWANLAPRAAEGHMLAQVPLTAGGWYELWFRANEQADPQRLLERVGVGEVFVTAGQSNAANWGLVKHVAQDPRVVSYYAGQWQPAQDPMPGAGGSDGSIWPLLGDMLARNLQVPIGFACVAVGGSASAQWVPGGEFYPLLVNTLRELGPGGARAVLWHQGESDIRDGTSARQYYDNLHSIVMSLREQMAWSPRWVVAGVAWWAGLPEAAPIPLEAQERLWREGLALEGPYTDDIGPEFRDGSHFNEAGLVMHAERWFALLWAQIYAKVPLVVRGE